MHPPVSAEQKEAMRELRALEPPTFPRIAAVAGLHVTTVREIASRENWPKLHVPHGSAMRVVRLKDEAAEEAARERAEALAALDETAGELSEMSPDDVGAFVAGEMRALLARARVTGRIDKAHADGLLSMLRVAQQNAPLQAEKEEQDRKRSDDELADILARVDRRIVELARECAERLVAEQLTG